MHLSEAVKGNNVRTTASIERVSPDKIFNLPIYEGYLIIDARSPQEYALGHIETAVSFPPFGSNFDTETQDKFLVKCLEFLHSLSFEHVQPISIYGNTEHANWIAQRLATLNSNPLTSISSDADKYFLRFYQKFRDLKTIFIIEGGYESFAREFSINCTNEKGICEFAGTPLPCAVAPGLFLGSRPVGSFERRLEKQIAYERPVLHKLGITTIIVNSEASLGAEDTLGVQCCLLELKEDDRNVNMVPLWESAIQIIEQNRTKGKVLLQVHGRSCSASFVIAWAMMVLRLSFEEAVLYVKSKLYYKLDPTLMYLDQLQAWTPPKLLQ